MSLYAAVANLELEIDGTETSQQSRATSSDFERHTSTIQLTGPTYVGLGEDVSYDSAIHHTLDAEGGPDISGHYTLDAFSSLLDRTDLFPGSDPDHPSSRKYRRWAYESAGLDLALRQAGRSLPSVFGREYTPVHFVVSTRLPDGDPGRVQAILGEYPGTEFKLDPTPEWDDETITTLAETGAVRILDLKGQYDGIEVQQPADLRLYDRLLSAFPDAIIEDPEDSPQVTDHIAQERHRLSWDAPVTDIETLENLPYMSRWLNIKPSRFGSLESLLATIEYCQTNGIKCYGGGQFELDVGRTHAQAFASLFYPDGPNDLAPGVYNEPGVPAGAPRSPLPRFASKPGLPR